MRFKKLIVFISIPLIVFAIAFFALAGTGKDEEKGKVEEAEIVYKGWLRSWEGVDLVLTSHQGPSTDAYKVLAKEFEELTGANVQVIDESWTDLLGKHLQIEVLVATSQIEVDQDRHTRGKRKR